MVLRLIQFGLEPHQRQRSSGTVAGLGDKLPVLPIFMYAHRSPSLAIGCYSLRSYLY